MMKKKPELIHPLWKNYYTDFESAYQNFVGEMLWEHNAFHEDTRPFGRDNENPLLSGYGKIGAIALAAQIAYDTKRLEYILEGITEVFTEEMKAGHPKKAKDLTPRQMAVIELDELRSELSWFVKERVNDSITAQSIAGALTLGAALMRLAIENPNSAAAKYMKTCQGNRERGKTGGDAGGIIPYEDLIKYLKEKKKAGMNYSQAEKEIARERCGRTYSQYKIRKRIETREKIPYLIFYDTL